MFQNLPLLSLEIWLPILGGIFALMTGDDRRAHTARMIALFTAIICLLLCVPLYLGYDNNSAAMQFTENQPWIAHYGIDYTLGVDGISLPLIMLTTLTTLVVVIASWRPIKTQVAQYMAAFLIMQGMMVGVFAALDAVLFYIFWEGMLIPMYLCIGMWGGANRNYASIKFFLYTFFGSALMLVALLYMRYYSGSFSILGYWTLKLSMTEQIWIFLAFLLAFAVKVPMFPFHTWLPDAHTEAPAGGSVVLAALMLKMGVYGFLRFSLPITPDASRMLDWVVITLSLIAIVYIALVAIGQKDMKRLIAYSSIAHMGFATLACFMIYLILNKTGSIQDAYLSLEGSMVQMISHAFSTGAMFFGVGILYERYASRMIDDFGGIVNSMPHFAAFFMLFCMANVGMPGTSGFVGEFMIILSAFKASPWIAFFAASTLVLAAAYTLWMYKRVFFGEVTHEYVNNFDDIKGSETAVMTILGVMVIALGVYPQPLLNMMHVTVGHLLTIANTTKLM
ncbi:MAG: NADH-quinone oxidoreductase subunit M [Legionellales bacterium]|nr:NADH-quinone oxidoreductase subunit M [Legionellales bacterium]